MKSQSILNFLGWGFIIYTSYLTFILGLLLLDRFQFFYLYFITLIPLNFAVGSMLRSKHRFLDKHGIIIASLIIIYSVATYFVGYYRYSIIELILGGILLLIVLFRKNQVDNR